MKKRRLSNEEKRKEDIIRNGWGNLANTTFTTPARRKEIILEFLENCSHINDKMFDVQKTLVNGGNVI